MSVPHSNVAAVGSYAYARKTMSTALTALTVSADSRVLVQGVAGSTVPLLRLFDGAGDLLASHYQLNATNGQIWVQHSGTFRWTTGMLPLNTWGQLMLRVSTAPWYPCTVSKTLNGTAIYTVQGASLGTAEVQPLQIGNEAHSRAFSLVADNRIAHLGEPQHGIRGE